jgi:two-component system, LuxR family, response regulator FixJ
MSRDSTVHVIDDDAAVRDSLEFLLSSAGIPTETHESAAAFLDTHRGAEVGCIVTDIRMPEISGLDLLRRVKEVNPQLPVILITGHGDVPLAVEAMKLGAADFIEKPFDDEALLAAIGVALDRSHQREREGARNLELRSRLASLSARERQVLDGLVAGNPNKTIAYDLGISPRTVEVYRANVMTKMQAATLSELVRMALVTGALPANAPKSNS